LGCFSFTTKGKFKKEISFLQKILDRKETVQVGLTVFRDVPEETKVFTIVNGQSHELRAFLERIVYDGGTHLTSEMLRKYSDSSEVCQKVVDW
jgi:hypothetical protein